MIQWNAEKRRYEFQRSHPTEIRPDDTNFKLALLNELSEIGDALRDIHGSVEKARKFAKDENPDG
jgi:hypothetical protein